MSTTPCNRADFPWRHEYVKLPVAQRIKQRLSETTLLHCRSTSQITSDEVHGGRLGHVAAAPGYDDGELDLVVQGLERFGHLDGGGGRGGGMEERRDRLQEQHGLLRSGQRGRARVLSQMRRGEREGIAAVTVHGRVLRSGVRGEDRAARTFGTGLPSSLAWAT
jgi:hypothetical protein